MGLAAGLPDGALRARAAQHRPGGSAGTAGVIWLAASLVAFWLCAAIGVGGAWLLRRRTTLSARNLYLLGGAASLLCGLTILARRWDALLVLAPLAAGPAAGALFARRWRLADLGAGEELRDHELSRRWFWQAGPEAAAR